MSTIDSLIAFEIQDIKKARGLDSYISNLMKQAGENKQKLYHLLIQYNKEINAQYAAAMDGEIERKHKLSRWTNDVEFAD